MFNCDCSDYDQPEFINVYERKARKSHRCSECGGIINKGERYKYISGKWDGDVASYKRCSDCLALLCDLHCACVAFGNLEQELLDQHSPRWGVDLLPELYRFYAYAQARGSIQKMPDWIKPDEEDV
jgi:hypothetical protein